MSLVPFDNIHRRVWMFPRNIRKIYPWKISQILSMIHMQLVSDVWMRNQALQNSFTANLEKFGLKREGVQYDPNSGGARTYFSQLESLGLLFTRDDGSTWLTIAGQDLVEGTDYPSEILRTQLLRYQYPSIYSKGSNVKIHPSIKIKPFLFILELLMDSTIQHLTDIEIIIPVIYGHNQNCFDLCKDKILHYRESGEIFDVIDHPDEDLFTPRTRVRTKENAIKDFKEIANTCKNFLESCSLVLTESDVISGTKRIIINEGVLPEIEKSLLNKSTFIPVLNAESFQRKYGAWNRKKDNRSLNSRVTKGVSKGEPIIHALFAEYAGNNLVTDTPEDFVAQAVNHGFDRNLVLKTIEPYLVNSLSLFEQEFLKLSTGGTSTANAFEKAVQQLFEKRLKYTTTHTGQRNRPSDIGGYSDIFIQEVSGRFCAIIDTKASPKYNLSASDYHTMVSSYIPSVNQLDEHKNEKFGFCAYVAGGFDANMDERIKKTSNDSGYSFTAIKAYDLLKLCQHEIELSEQYKITDVFCQKKLVTVSDFTNVIN